MTRVLQVTLCKFPPEIRVLKNAKTLRDAGYESAVLCPAIGQQPEEEHWNGIRIFRPSELAPAKTAVDKVLFQSAYFSPAWWRATRAVLRSYRPAVVHIHDIWLARSVLAAVTSQRVVMDLHENMPAAVDEYVKAYHGAFRLFNQVFKSRSRVYRYEASALQRSDSVLVVVEEARARVLAEHPTLDPEKVVVVENLESKDFLASLDQAAAQAVPADDVASILYVGGFGPHRGIDTLIEAVAHLKAWGVPVRLDLVGATRGSHYVQMLHALIERLNVGSHVRVVKWVDPESVPTLIRQATLAAVPHHSNPHTDATIPHKLFQYMMVGTPVLVSTSAPLARTVHAAKSGIVFEAGHPLDCAEKIRAALVDRQALRALGNNGHDYVMRQQHNWEEESAPALLQAYGSLVKGTPKQVAV